MAKKRKQKKTGMLKRQKEKRQKKMIRRRKAMPKRNPQQAGSPQQLEQLLNTLPTLAFEPELTDLIWVRRNSVHCWKVNKQK